MDAPNPITELELETAAITIWRLLGFEQVRVECDWGRYGVDPPSSEIFRASVAHARGDIVEIECAYGETRTHLQARARVYEELLRVATRMLVEHERRPLLSIRI